MFFGALIGNAAGGYIADGAATKGGISGLGGLYIVMNSSNGVGGVWVHDCIGGYGWLSVALVIFASW